MFSRNAVGYLLEVTLFFIVDDVVAMVFLTISNSSSSSLSSSPQLGLNGEAGGGSNETPCGAVGVVFLAGPPETEGGETDEPWTVRLPEMGARRAVSAPSCHGEPARVYPPFMFSQWHLREVHIQTSAASSLEPMRLAVNYVADDETARASSRRRSVEADYETASSRRRSAEAVQIACWSVP